MPRICHILLKSFDIQLILCLVVVQTALNDVRRNLKEIERVQTTRREIPRKGRRFCNSINLRYNVQIHHHKRGREHDLEELGGKIEDNERHSATMGWKFFDRWVVLACLVATILVPVFVIQVQVAVEEFSRRARLGSLHHVVVAASDSPSKFEPHQSIDMPYFGLEFLGDDDLNYEKVRELTNNLSTSLKVGEGRFGAVYKSSLGGARDVAIRRLEVLTRCLNSIQFIEQIRSLRNVQHMNILPLLEFYVDQSRLNPGNLTSSTLLVYPFYTNLATELRNLAWPERYKVGLDIAEALHYLHRGTRNFVRIGSLQLKNILVDKNVHGHVLAYITDVGLEDIFSSCKFPGCTDVEVSRKADVWEFGKLLATLVAGRQRMLEMTSPEDINLTLEDVDPILKYQFNREQVQLMLAVAFSCMQEDPGARPKISDALSMLKGCLKGRISHVAGPHRSFIVIDDNTLTIQVYYVTGTIPFMCLTLLLTLINCFYVWRRFLQWRSGSSSISDVDSSTSRKDKEESDSNRPSSKFLHEFIAYREEELKKAADGFSKQIGEGSYGIVFEGALFHEGEMRKVAIKRMKGVYHKGLNDDFKKEVRGISMLRHKNVVQLLGYSDGDSKEDVHLLMVTPLHSSLAKHLEEPDKYPWLNWRARLKIGLGVAEGLTYLHDQAPQQFIHHDIKPGNILFDDETFQPYIADFGTARLMPRTQEAIDTDTFVGTSAYADPHFKDNRSRSVKVDVYSFGVLLYVLIGGAPRESVPTFVKNARDDNIIDPEFEKQEDATYNQEEINRCLAIAKQCTEYNPDKRPRMYQVVMMMKGDIPVWSIAQDVSRVAASAAMFAHSSIGSLRRFSTQLLMASPTGTPSSN